MKTKVVMYVCFAIAVVSLAQSTQAQGINKITGTTAGSGGILRLAPDTQERLQGGPLPSAGYVDLRSELLNLADTVQQFVEIAPSGLVNPEALEEARLQIQQMSAHDMEVIGKGIDPVKLHNRLMGARMALGEYSKALAESNGAVHGYLVPRTGQGAQPMDTFPVTGGACTSSNGTDVNRIPVSIVLAADVTWFVADGVRESAQDGCKQDAVVAGEGGNGSTACIPVDAVWIAAKAVNEGIHFCEDDLTGNVVDANYARLGFIHDQVTGVDNHLTNVDNHVSGEIAALQAQMVALLAALSNQVGNVQASVDLANQRLLKSIAAERQIMKLDLLPNGQRSVVPAILSCTGSDCPNPLSQCDGPDGTCAWNKVGPLP